MVEIKNVFLKNKWFVLLSIGLILIISYFTCHSDIVNATRATAIVASGNLQIITRSDNGEYIYESFFPPVFHLIDSLIYFPLQKIGVYGFNLDNLQPSQLLYVGFLLKLRYLILFILGLVLVIKISNLYRVGIGNKNKIFLLYLLCSVLIFVPFSWGNMDIYPVFLILLFLFFAFGKNYFWAMFFLGLSAATKNFALFLIPVVSLVLSEKRIVKFLFYSLIGFSVYIIPLFLYRSASSTFISGGGEGLFILSRNVLGGPLFFPMAYFSVLLFLITKQKIVDINKNEVLVKYCFLVLSLFYLASFFIPHWFLWIMPFFILTAYKDKRLFYLYNLITLVFFISLYSWSKNIDASLFATAFPIINKMPTLADVINRHFADFKIFEIFYSLFFAAFLTYLYILFFDKKKDDLTEKEVKIFSLIPLFIYLFVCFIYIMGMNYVYKLKNCDWYDLGLIPGNEFIGSINRSGMFYQTFKSPKKGLKGLNIYLSTYGKNIVSSYELVLYNGDCKTELRKVDIGVKIEDNKYKEILFDQFLNSDGQKYCFTIRPKDSEIKNFITLNYSQKDFYSEGELILNGKETKDDVVFQLIYPL